MWITIKDAMAILGLSRNTLYEIIEKKELPAYKVGGRRGRIRLKAEEVDEYIERGRTIQRATPLPPRPPKPKQYASKFDHGF